MNYLGLPLGGHPRSFVLGYGSGKGAKKMASLKKSYISLGRRITLI